VSSLGYQEVLARALYARDEGDLAFPAGASAERWNVYRRMVRQRIAEQVEHAFERLRAVIGAERLRALIERFLVECPPRSNYLRDVPGEFLQFFEAHRRELAQEHALPPFAVDLARYEWAELDTAYSFEENGSSAVGPLDMARVPVLSPAHRLVDVAYPVHRLGADANDAALAPEPQCLCLYRDSKTHEVEVLELTPVTGAMLALMAARTLPLTEIVRSAADQVGVLVDVAFVEALSTLLADLLERGVLLGSLVPKETS
jgi:hypothetical protein